MHVENIERKGEVQRSMLANATTGQLAERLNWTVHPQVKKRLTHTHRSNLNEHDGVKL